MQKERFHAHLAREGWEGRGEREKKKVCPIPKKRKMVFSTSSIERRELDLLRSPHREEDGFRDCYSPTHEQMAIPARSPPTSPRTPPLTRRPYSPSILSSSFHSKDPNDQGEQRSQKQLSVRFSFRGSLDSHHQQPTKKWELPFRGSLDSHQPAKKWELPAAKKERKNPPPRKPKTKVSPRKKRELINIQAQAPTSSSGSSSEDEGEGGTGFVSQRVRSERKRTNLPFTPLSSDGSSRLITTDSPREKRTSCTSDSDEPQRVVRYRSEERGVAVTSPRRVIEAHSSDTSSSSSSSNSSDTESSSNEVHRASIDFMLDCIDNDNDNDDDLNMSDILDDEGPVYPTSSDEMTSSDLTSDEYDSESDQRRRGESNFADEDEDLAGGEESSNDNTEERELLGGFRGWGERVAGLDLSVGKYTREVLGLSRDSPASSLFDSYDGMGDSRSSRDSRDSRDSVAKERDGFGFSSDTETDTDSDFGDLHLSVLGGSMEENMYHHTRELRGPKKRAPRRKGKRLPRKHRAKRGPWASEIPQSQEPKDPFSKKSKKKAEGLSKKKKKKNTSSGSESGGHNSVAEGNFPHVFRCKGGKKSQAKLLENAFFLQKLASLFVSQYVMANKQNLTFFPADFLQEWTQGVFLHLLALPILHPIFCIFLMTLSNLIPYNNFFQAIAVGGSMGLFQTLLSTMFLHGLHDVALITAKAFFHQFISVIPQRKPREMGLRRRNFEFMQKVGGILASLLRKFFRTVAPLITTTLLTASFIVVITRLLVHNAHAIEGRGEPIGVIGTLESLSQESNGLFGATMRSGSFLMGVMILRELSLVLFPKSKIMIYSLFTLALPFSFSVLVRVSLGELYGGTVCHSGSDCVEVLIREGLLNLFPKYCAFCWVIVPVIIAGVVI